MARVDRNAVELNESLTLEIVVDSDISAEPDLANLAQDFHVGQGSQLSNTTIINGKIQYSRTWTYVLMPKRTGRLTIPPIALGAERSEPIVVAVNEPSHAPPGEADVFITSAIDYAETYVQAQVLYTVKIYRAVPTRQPTLRDPSIDGVEVLVELAGDDRSYESVIDGRAYNVVERTIALYPQESGEISISPARFEARVLKDGRITGRRVYQSEPQSITVLPIPPPPPGHPDASWLPAREVELSEVWSRVPEELTAGEPVTRDVTISALGQLETQIPALEAPEVEGINIYADKPDLRRRVEAGGIRGLRTDQYAMIGVTPGAVRMPALELPWWSIDAREWRIARLPERTISVLSSGEEPPRSGPPAATPAEPVGERQPPALPGGANLWRRASGLLFGLWVVTLALWWWSARRRERPPRPPAAVPLHKRQAKSLKAAQRAAHAGDSAGARAAMLEWARLEWPDAPPRNIGAIAARVSSPLADELAALSRQSYGPVDEPWDGSALTSALRSFKVLDEPGTTPGEALPPLMPGR